jgi:hypothetical protein
LWTETGVLSAVRLPNFTFSNVEHYLMVFSDRNVAVYRAGVLQANVRSPFTSAQLSLINWTQSLDYMLIVHSGVAQQQLVRQGSHTDWQIDPVAFTTIPFYAFVLTTTNPVATLTPSAVEGNITLTASAASFSSNDINQYVTGNGGRARITGVTSSTVVKATVEIPFFDATVIASGSWTIERGYEAVWSTTRGFPVSVCFYETRLVFGGSRDRPSTVWLSRTGLFFDFNRGTQLDDDAIDITMQADEVPSICNVFPGRHLQIFTTSGEYFCPQGASEPLTPSNTSIRKQTSRGAKPGARVAEVSGATLFIQQQGKALREFIFVDTEQAYNSNNISLLSSHLILNPIDMALHRSTSTDEADFVLLANTGGTLAVLTTLREQDVTAWSLLSTAGSFLATGVDLTEMYFVIERVINGQTVRYLERFNANMRTDAGRYVTTGLPLSSLTNLGHLEGKIVDIVLDGAVQLQKTVVGGTVVFNRAAVTSIDVGIPFAPLVTTMPFARELPDGTVLGRKKRIVEATLELFETSDIIVFNPGGGGAPERPAFRSFGPAGGGSPLDAVVVPFTGRKTVEGIIGWDELGQLTITQDKPTPMTLLALELKIKV